MNSSIRNLSFQEYDISRLVDHCVQSIQKKEITVISDFPSDRLDSFSLLLSQSQSLGIMPQGFFFRKRRSKYFVSGNGTGFPTAPILPHNEGVITNERWIKLCLFWVERSADEGGENILSPNHTIPKLDWNLSGNNYITGQDEELDQCESVSQLFPYATMWQDRTVYNTFVDYLRTKDVGIKNIETASFDDYLNQAFSSKDFPLSKCTDNFGTPERLESLKKLFVRSSTIKSKPRDLIIFSNYDFTHARAPFRGDRKLWSCFLTQNSSWSDKLVTELLIRPIEWYRRTFPTKVHQK